MSINIKTSAELGIMADGGARLIEIFRAIKQQLVPGTTLKTLDNIARQAAEQQGGQPSFLGYRDYPAAICASVNHGIVHCIPNDYQLQAGDLVSIDCGLFYQGFHTDAAVTWIVGEDIHHYQPLLDQTYRSLLAGVNAVQAGVKVGEISSAIAETLKATQLTIMKQFVGHGVGRNLHEDPIVPNFVGHDKNVVLPAGSVIAIEPIAGRGTEDYGVTGDRWSTFTTDREPVAHFEMTVAVTEAGARILTPIDQVI
ncbi:MAG: Methionine aminopeptidase [candidate division Kazan bacterium GW2011_GWB1_45_10]|uniref:Methionine aminopeptidase n=1 Tax=candidate division Kazan bacterium GW2011_GWB1_45_10 TaxID=1620411 RepID=A0A0G1KU84_UNCK3|nr:MAG: Methionine aminopeptidase [candidate division Kazan bacterium GW2011_GWB1_45_10]